MSATAAVRGLLRIPRAGPDFLGIEAVEDDHRHWLWHARADNLRNILCHGGHSVTRLSSATGERFGIDSSFFIPPTFVHKLRNGITPHVCQMAALSEVTGYRLVDWLQFFGFDLSQISRLQMRLHTERTVLVTPVESGRDFFLPQIRAGKDFSGSEPSRYLFAKIGSRDAEICPRLFTGSVVRIDRWWKERSWDDRSCNSRFRNDHDSSGDHLWLVDLPGGLTCCQVRWIDHQQIVLLPNRSPWGCWPLRLPTEARVLGRMDTDGEARYTGAECREEKSKTLSELLRLSRRRTGLTFRAAHDLTLALAGIMGNRDYAIALGMLSDYEVMGKLPRQPAKILSLCIVFCMDFWQLMKAAGVDIDESAKLPLPATAHFHLPSEHFTPSSQHSLTVS
jgi:hypothetical protein